MNRAVAQRRYQKDVIIVNVILIRLKFDFNFLTMLTTIKGMYDNGKIVLEETPPIKNKVKVVVTFLDESNSPDFQKRPFGSLKGKIGIPDDFNEPIDDLKEYM